MRKVLGGEEGEQKLCGEKIPTFFPGRGRKSGDGGRGVAISDKEGERGAESQIPFSPKLEKG